MLKNLNLIENSIIESDTQITIIFIIVKTLFNKEISVNDESMQLYSLLLNELKYFHINETIIINKIKKYNETLETNKKITFHYSLDNFINIINYIKKSIKNTDFISDIVELLFIIAFHLFFNIDKQYTYNFHFFENCYHLSNPKNFEYLEKNALNTKLFLNNKELLQYFEKKNSNQTLKENELSKQYFNLNITENSILKNFPVEPDLNYINELKKIIPNAIIPIIYINLYIKIKKINYFIKQIQDENLEELGETKKYFYTIIQSIYYNPILLYRNFFHQTLLVYQIKNSEYMKLENCPFDYNFYYAKNEVSNSQYLVTGIKFDKRIKIITFSKNELGEIGMFELAKNLSFNKNIEIIDFSIMNITPLNLKYFLKGFFVSHLYNIQELNLSKNNDLEKGGIYIAKILEIFRSLKTLNLNQCNLKSGMKPILIQLKKLYLNNYPLENLYISSNNIGLGSIFLLGDIIKLKKCNLKILVCNHSNMKNIAGHYFLNNINKNSNLQQLYMYDSGFDDHDYPFFKKLIINSKLNVLSIYKNRIKNFETIIKLLSLTQNIPEEQDKEKKLIYKIKNNQLFNFDVSENPIMGKLILKDDIILLKNICKYTGLAVFDMIHILGKNDNKEKENHREKEEEDLIKIIKEKKSLRMFY